MTTSGRRRVGLTLLELVVVLAVLAILTTLAVALTEGTVEQARFDITQRQLQAINDAILGPAGQPDAAAFVADTGRLPVGNVDPADAGGEVQLAELWFNPNALPAFGPATAAVDGAGAALPAPVPSVLSGWRGPYLALPPGQTKLRDGWGRPFSLAQQDGVTPAANATPIGQVLSSDPTRPSPFNTLALSLPSAPYPAALSTNIWTGSVQGSVVNPSPTAPSPSGPVIVRLFVPDVSKTPPVRVMTYRTTATNLYQFRFPIPAGGDSANPSPDADSQLAVPIGRKALQVYQSNSPVGPVVYLAVTPGGVMRTIYCNIQ